MTRQAVILLGVPVTLAALVAVPLGMVLGPIHWLSAGVAVVLTVAPGVVTLILAHRLARSSAYGSLVALVLGTLVRLVVGFGGAVVVFLASGDTFRAQPVVFWAWLLGAYLVTLIVETALLGRRVMAAGDGGGRESERGIGRGHG